ncbi:hypothetical protein J2853_003398 [Streptosporangium lutulentum]|uniref:Uncharacterized protein n=1 Tax=Streptosporangium lutulentum TaxID=1461250 RepID=A0ABT9QBN8_9ACTN|nr:hypothetical protein [Streptosporangium lutulentum]
MAEVIGAGYGPGGRHLVMEEAPARREAGRPVRMRMPREALR